MHEDELDRFVKWFMSSKLREFAVFLTCVLLVVVAVTLVIWHIASGDDKCYIPMDSPPGTACVLEQHDAVWNTDLLIYTGYALAAVWALPIVNTLVLGARSVVVYLVTLPTRREREKQARIASYQEAADNAEQAVKELDRRTKELLAQ